MGDQSVGAQASCPDLELIEEIASGARVDVGLSRHLTDCAICRERIAEIRANNQIIHQFVRPVSNGSSPPAAPATSDLILGYELGREIHHGGQGIVYEAVQKSTKRLVAVKMLRHGALTTARQRQRFEREIELVAGMKHPSIVTVYESGDTADGRRYFAMALIRGKPLDHNIRAALESGMEDEKAIRSESRDHIAVAGCIPTNRDAVRRTLDLFIQICDAVQYAHRRGVIHRDLKPANILVDEVGDPHILDFGVAKAIGEDAGERLLATRAGEFMGTVAYAAPEQVEGRIEQIDTRTDVYALGVILYEMLTGRLPCEVEGAISDVIRSITQDRPPPPSRHNRALSDELDMIILKAMEKDRARRYQSAESFRQDLERYLRNEPIDARRDSTWYVFRKSLRRHRVPATVAAAFLLLIVGFAIVTAVNLRQTAFERDKAIKAERDVVQSAAQLASALSQSNVERARLMVRTGNVASAEDIIWREFLRPDAAAAAERHNSDFASNKTATPVSSRTHTGGAPLAALRDSERREMLDAYWALRELYAASHCVATVAPAGGERMTLAVAPEGDRIVTAGQNGVVQVWSLPISRERELFRIQLDPVYSAAFVGADRLALIMVRDERIQLGLLDVRTGRPEAPWRDLAALSELRPGTIITRFSRDGQRLALLGADGQARILDTVGGATIATIPYSAGGHITTFALSRDGSLLALGGVDHTIRIYDVQRAVELRRIRTSPPNPFRFISAMTFSPDASQLAVGWGEGGVEVWDAVAGTRSGIMRDHTYGITTVEFSPDGRRLLTGGHDKSLILWELPSNRTLLTGQGHRAAVLHAMFSSGGEAIVSVGLDGLLKEWDTALEPGIRRLAGHQAASFSLLFDPDGDWIASGGAGPDNRLRLWDRRTHQLTTAEPVHREAVGGIALLAERRALLSASYDGEMRVWSLPADGDASAQLHLRHKFDTGLKVPSCIAGSADGRFVAAGAYENRVVIWRTADLFKSDGETAAGPRATQSLIPLHSVGGGAARTPCVVFSRDSRRLAACSTDRTVRLIDTETGALLASFIAHTGTVRWARFFDSDRRLITCGDDGKARLWDMSEVLRQRSGHEANLDERSPDERCLRVFAGHEQDVMTLDISPNEKILATGARDGSIRIWSIADGRTLTTLEGHRQAVYSVAFSPDGRTLASVGEDRDVCLMDLHYFDRHLMGNIEYQQSRAGGSEAN